MQEHQFDELARLVGTSTSRRQVLKILAGAAVGTLAGSRVAFAKNMTCAQFCQGVFGENTPAEEQCAADAAHHRGLCYTCGPQAPGGGVSPSNICCTRNTSNVCTSYSGATCCASNQTCQNGQCVCVPNCTGKTCGSDGCGGSCGTCQNAQTCTNGSCVCPDGGTTCSTLSDCLALDVNAHCVAGCCCQLHLGPDSVCSAALPCCAGAQCQSGHCCLPTGGSCNGNNSFCCSGMCDPVTNLCV